MEDNKIDYDAELRGLDFSRYCHNEIIALLRYRNDRMLELNKTRAISSIDIIINTMEELKEKLK